MPLFQAVLRGGEAVAADQGVVAYPFEQVALGMTEADFGEAWQHRQQPVRGDAVIAVVASTKSSLPRRLRVPLRQFLPEQIGIARRFRG